MKRLSLIVGAVLALACMSAPLAFAGNGNGAPSGPHFNLNIHGVAKGQGFNGNNTNDIFVPLNGQCNIMLQSNLLLTPFDNSFGVVQPDCVNNRTAEFSLPAPCAIDNTTGLCVTTSTVTFYSVWARALGKPGGSSNVTTCATDPLTNEPVCSINSVVAVRGTGHAKFSDVSSCLLFLTETTGVQVPIFSPNLENFLWQYDNTGLRLLQLRFYQVPSAIPLPSTTVTNCNVK